MASGSQRCPSDAWPWEPQFCQKRDIRMPVDRPLPRTNSNRVQWYVTDRRWASPIGPTLIEPSLSSHTIASPPPPPIRRLRMTNDTHTSGHAAVKMVHRGPNTDHGRLSVRGRDADGAPSTAPPPFRRNKNGSKALPVGRGMGLQLHQPPPPPPQCPARFGLLSVTHQLPSLTR